MIRRLTVSLLALTLVAAPACSSVARREAMDAKEARWKTAEVEAASDRVLWQLTLLSIQNLGFPLAAGTDLGARRVESGWKTDMQPFRGDGERKRAIVVLTPLEPGRWKIETRVQVEHNQNLVSPLDPVRADWQPTKDDEAGAQVLLQHIRTRLQPELEVAPRNEARP